jgi:hypothetical protein
MKVGKFSAEIAQTFHSLIWVFLKKDGRNFEQPGLFNKNQPNLTLFMADLGSCLLAK